jgi:hypothetical protein
MKTADRIRSNKKVQELEIEPDIFVTLNYGYQMDGAHCFGEDTLTDVIRTLKSVEPCDCHDCIANLNR